MLEPEKSLRNIVQTVASFRSNIVILTEVSASMIEDFVDKVRSADGFRYQLIHGADLDTTSNTVVLVEKRLFPFAEILEFPGEHAKAQSGSKKVRIRLVSMYGSVLNIIAAH